MDIGKDVTQSRLLCGWGEKLNQKNILPVKWRVFRPPKNRKGCFYSQHSGTQKQGWKYHPKNFPLSTLNDIRSFINRQLAGLSRIILVQPVHEQEWELCTAKNMRKRVKNFGTASLCRQSVSVSPWFWRLPNGCPVCARHKRRSTSFCIPDKILGQSTGFQEYESNRTAEFPSVQMTQDAVPEANFRGGILYFSLEFAKFQWKAKSLYRSVLPYTFSNFPNGV